MVMTIQTPRETAEALSDIGPTGYALTKEQYHERLALGWCEHCKVYHRDMLHLAARDRALLAEDEAAIEAMAHAAMADDPIVFGMLSKTEREETATAMLAALRRHHGVE